MNSIVPLPSESWNSGSTECISLLRLPRELVLLVLDCLTDSELTSLCVVSSESRHLALLTLLARHGVPESQRLTEELSSVSAGAVRILSVAYPSLMPKIHRLDLKFKDGDVDHLRPWRSLVHLAERFPVIPYVTFTFSPRSTASERFAGLWNLLPTTLIAFMGNNNARSVVIINYLHTTAIQPKQPNLLKRALNTPRRSSIILPAVVDRMKLTRTLMSSIATASTRRLLSNIYLRSFTDPTAPVGVLLILNPWAVFYLDIAEHTISDPEWEFLLPQLDLPKLRTLFVRVDFEHRTLSAFLEKHAEIEHLAFMCDWTCIHDPAVVPFSTSALSCLTNLSASAHVIARVLALPNAFPLLTHVGIGAPESNNPADAVAFQAALRAVAGRPSVTSLTVDIQNAPFPWTYFDAKAPAADARAERELHCINKIQLTPWTREERDAPHTFPAWLALFPGLQELCISGSLFPPTKGPLVSDWLLYAVKSACPQLVVKQERRLR
ncbi:hypothetical protein C8R47DRAFT_188659 [Mycena vitilis]|nr:hypothetical protein C8R47DRAFT_188659 [Mycena vitilis]